MKTRLVREGAIKLLVPDVILPEHGSVFFNPVMRLSRDVSICVYEGRSFCDPLAASGARGLRVAKELGIQSTLGDKNPKAIELLKKNAKANRVKHVEMVKSDANGLMAGRWWDVVDIDPFGSPVPFLDMAVNSAINMVSITATDTAALCGVYPAVARRRYQAVVPGKTEFFQEVGLRALIGSAVRTAAKYDMALEPVLSHSSLHFYRIYFKKKRGAGRTDAALASLGGLRWCPTCLSRGETDCCGKETIEFGPLWMGKLFERSAVEVAAAKARKFGFEGAQKLLEQLSEEGDEKWFYDIHALAERAKRSPPPLESLLIALRSAGFTASRTHISPIGFRTTASTKEIQSILKDL